ncbi:MAG: hypothetical protein IKJ06_02035 [Clostridia bacterium]|nr:hypothetical protein [Clostridia bacterium]
MIRYARKVYDTMIGNTVPAFRVQGVENIFEKGKPYYDLYMDACSARDRLAERLNVLYDFDDDMQMLFNSLLDMQDEVAIAMFLKGYEFGQNGCPPVITLFR